MSSTKRLSVQRAGWLDSVPPPVMIVISIASVQLGASIAKQLFPELGPSGSVFLRVGFSALILLGAWRPRLLGHSRSAYLTAVLFGVVLAAMNFAFYSALARIPLGIAVTIEFVGPLGVAVTGSRRVLDLVWVTLAASGILLLAPWTGGHLDPLGVLLALLAGVCWAAYIVLNAQLGRAFRGGSGLALSMAIAAIVLAPIGVPRDLIALTHPWLLLAGLGAAVLSSVIPYSLELEALRRIPTHVFGILMSIEPAFAAFFGFIILHERLELRGLIAMLLVIAATLGATTLGRQHSA